MNNELSIAISRNFLFKTKIMLIVFSFIFVLQLAGISFAYFSSFVDAEFIGRAIYVPLFLIVVVVDEILVYRYIRKKLAHGNQIKTRTYYLVSLLEISFPTVVFAYGCHLINGTDLATPYFVLNSPPEFIYFIFLITASFLLDSRLCFILGLVAALEYLGLCIAFLSEDGGIEFGATSIKSILLFATGILSGVVSGTIRKSVLASLEAQRILIEELDFKVKERTFEINQQKEIIEEKQKEIVDSINYAKRIQYTLLAHESFLKQNLKDHFVLFKPKDIVSGDFYWATEKVGSGSKQFYLAVCDCTGHGVPGAFMSLLNISFLNEAINEKNISTPNEVLNHVRMRLIQNMEGYKDGMDATLIRFTMNKIQYASAHNRPLLIRNNQIINLIADKMPVGKGEKSNSFTLHELEISKEDLIYFFTDGFADQFGGAKGKKFKYKNLEKLLLENSGKSMLEQSQILNQKFEEWKGDLEQVDDVCIIGIKI